MRLRNLFLVCGLLCLLSARPARAIAVLIQAGSSNTPISFLSVLAADGQTAITGLSGAAAGTKVALTTGATATSTLTAGAVSAITVTAGGSGYTSAPAVTLLGGGGNRSNRNREPYGGGGVLYHRQRGGQRLHVRADGSHRGSGRQPERRDAVLPARPGR